MKPELLLLVLALATASGQTVSSSLKGVLHDSTGAVVVGATCTLSNQGTGSSTSVSSLADGSCTFANIPAGSYGLRVEMAGFRVLQMRNIDVTSSELRTLGRLTLEVGEVLESVSVNAESAAIQLASAERSGLISGTQLNDIAVKGRDLFAFLTTMPGVVNTIGDGGGEDSLGVGAMRGISLNGNAQNSKNVTVDGITAINTGNNTFLMYEPNMDAVSEVKVLSSSYGAEYGRMGGGQISIITKSGTREFHGSAYNYYRHETLNANSFFNNRTATERPPYRYRVTGFSIGGPVLLPGDYNRNRDKLFFFFSQEWSGTKLNPGTRLVTMPTALERAGDFSQSRDVNGTLIPIRDPDTGATFPGNKVPQNRISPGGQSILNALPLPNHVDPDPLNLYRYNYRTAPSSPYPKRQEIWKIDYQPTSTLRISYRGVNNKDTQEAHYGLNQGKSGPANYDLGLVFYGVPGKGHVFNVTKTFSATLISETTIGFNQTRSLTDPVDEDAVSRQRWGNLPLIINDRVPLENTRPGRKPDITFGNTPVNPAIPNTVGLPWYNLNRNWDFTQSVSKIMNRHQLKFGVFLTNVLKSDPSGGLYNGSFDFGRDVNNPLDTRHGFSNTLIGNFRSYTEDNDRPSPYARLWNIEPYIQDNWRVTSRLTLDLGMRFYTWTPSTQVEYGSDCDPIANPRGFCRPGDASQSTFDPSLWNPAQAVRLYQPALVNRTRVALDPVTGEARSSAFIGTIVNGSGNLLNGIAIGGQTAGHPDGLEKFPGVALGPRFGFGYDLFGNGSTAVRGGFGVYYSRRTSGTGSNPPMILRYEILQGNISQISQLSSTAGRASQNVSSLLGEVRLPTTMNFNFGVQHRVKDMVVDVSYVGGLSRHQYASRNWNAVPLGARFNPANEDPSSPGRPLPNALLVPYPGYGNLNLNQPQSSSNYNSLQASVNRRMGRGLQFGVSYTFSKALGTGGLTPLGYADADPQFADRNWSYGPLGIDRSQTLVFNYVYETPRVGQRMGSRVAGWILDEWQLSGITRFISGEPFTPTFSTTDGQDITGSALNARITVVGDPELSKGEKTFFRNFNTDVFKRTPKGSFGDAGVGLLRGPGVNNWDIALSKMFPLGSEARRLRFRAEAFNAFNHTQFSGLYTNARFDTAGKQVDPNFGAFNASRSPRVIQLSLRLTF